MRTTTLTLLLLSLAVGCSRTRSYQVSLTNHTDKPLTFGVVKQGAPYERTWASPEEATRSGDRPSASMWGALPPGKTATSEEFKGRFRRNSEAVLRVYSGELDLPGVMAVDSGAPNRVDLPLKPGMNRVVVIDIGGHLEAVPADNKPERLSAK